MARVFFDLSFARDGQPLRHWLEELVSPDPTNRDLAGDALMAMLMGVSSVHEELTELEGQPPGPSHQDSLWNAVRMVIEEPSFPVHSFFLALAGRILGAKEEWFSYCEQICAGWSRTDEQYERVLQRLKVRLDADSSPQNRERQSKRVARALCAVIRRDWKDNVPSEQFEAFSHASLMSSWVFEHGGPRLLEVPESIWMLLEFQGTSHVAEGALTRIGSAAQDFAAHFLEQLDHTTAENATFPNARTLAAIARGVGPVIDQVIERLDAPSRRVRQAAADTLAQIAPGFAGRTEVAFERLNRLFQQADERGRLGLFDPWASVGRDRAEVRSRVLDLTLPRPPILRKEMYGDYTWEQDLVMIERSVAISACVYFTPWPDEAVPVLARSFRTFEEYDPDLTYRGNHERVCYVLQAFGPRAAVVVPIVIELLHEWLAQHQGNEQFPADLLELLTSIGPAARPALPVLRQMRRQCEANDPLELQPESSPLDKAIYCLSES